MRRVVAITVVIGSLVLSVGSVNARQTSDAPPTFRAGVDVVRLDVSVLDKNRQPVTGLTAADFTVLEDGKPRPVVSFTPIDLPEAAPLQPNTASWTREVAPDVATNAVPEDGRLVIIMFDWSIRARDLRDARRIATAAVNALGPRDEAAIVFSNPAANAGTPQNFTADRARLIETINRPIAVAETHAKDIRDYNGEMIEDPEGNETGLCHCRACVFDAVTRIADLIRDVPGRRKTLLFIGTIFEGYDPAPPNLYTGTGSPFYDPFYTSSPPIGVFPPGPGMPPPAGNGLCVGPLNEARGRMQRATGLANLTIDAVDPAGLVTQDDDPFGGMATLMQKRMDDLHIMPDMTGGRTIVDANEPEDQVPALLDESASYYVIGFERASVVNDGRLHSINVKVDQSGVTVRTRTGYLATDALAAAESLDSGPITRALNHVLPENGVPLTAAVAAFAPPTRTAPANVAVIVAVHEPPSPASAPAAASAVPHHVLVGLFDADGRSLGKAEQTVTITADGASGAAAFEVLSILPSKPGRYEVRAAVDGSADGRGSVYTYVDVPDFAKAPLSMSGLLLHVVPPTPIAVPDQIANVLPAVPTARRVFAANDQVTASLRIYQGGGNAPVPVGVTVRIVDAHDRRVFDQSIPIDASRFDETRAADVSLALPVHDLDPGEYLLTIDATAGSHTAHDDVRFTRIER